MLRIEDTAKVSHRLRSQTSIDDDMTVTTTTPGSSFSSAGSTQSAPSSIDDELEYMQKKAQAVRDANYEIQRTALKTLTPEETIELTREAVENGVQETKRSLAGSEAVSDVVRPKLTIDLGHSNIAQIPEAVVDMIKDEVERYVLSPWAFASIRSSSVYEIPS